MKTLFLEARVDMKITLDDVLLKQLPEKIALFTTIQFFDNLENLKKQLEKAGKKVVLLLGPHSKYDGQILGCTIEKFDSAKYKDMDFDAFLYIGEIGRASCRERV